MTTTERVRRLAPAQLAELRSASDVLDRLRARAHASAGAAAHYNLQREHARSLAARLSYACGWYGGHR